MRKYLRALAACILPAALTVNAVAAAAHEGWLPVSRSDIVELTVSSANGAKPDVESLDKVLQQTGNDAAVVEEMERQRSQLTKTLAPDDSVSFAFSSTGAVAVLMVGRDEQVHSLRIFVNTVTLRSSESDHLFGSLSKLFGRLYPDWQEAHSWPAESLHAAWNNSSLVTDVAPADLNNTVVRTQRGGIISTTFGVPPDFVVYEVTARERCMPDLNQRDPLRDLMCAKEERPFRR
jgi:hypothetical protein